MADVLYVSAVFIGFAVCVLLVVVVDRRVNR